MRYAPGRPPARGSTVDTLLKTLALVATLGIDTFAVSVALGLSGLSRREQLRYGIAFATAEGLMPLAGFGVGHIIAAALSRVAPYLAALLLLGVGLYTIRESFEEEEPEFEEAGLMKLVITALSVSMDELAVGFSLGLLHVSVPLAIALIVAQALLVTLLGTTLGRAVGSRVAGRAELMAGVVLSLLAVYLAAEQLVA